MNTLEFEFIMQLFKVHWLVRYFPGYQVLCVMYGLNSAINHCVNINKKFIPLMRRLGYNILKLLFSSMLYDFLSHPFETHLLYGLFLVLFAYCCKLRFSEFYSNSVQWCFSKELKSWCSCFKEANVQDSWNQGPCLFLLLVNCNS